MKISKYQWGSPIEGWSSQWKDRLQPSARSKVLQKWNASGKKPKPESSNEYTKRRVKEETKRTWRSDAADIAHGIGEGVLALHPYTAIPYYVAKVGQDVLNGNLNWETALNASIPLFHLSPQAVGLREATNVALEDAANAGSKTARNWRVAREINQSIKNNNVKSPSRYITKDYNYNDDGRVSSIMYQLHDPIFGEQLGNGTISAPYSGTKGRPVGWIESQNGAKGVTEDIYNVAVDDAKTYGDLGIESGWYLMEPQKTLAVTSKFPHIVVGESEGHPVRLLTGTTGKQQPYFIQQSNHHFINTNIKYNFKTGKFEEVNPNIINGDKTSLKFFERKPARKPLSIAESLGISRGDRGNLSKFQKDALEDLEWYINSGQYRQYPSMVDGTMTWKQTFDTNPETLEILGRHIRPKLYKETVIQSNLRGDNVGLFNITVPGKSLNGGEATLRTYDSGTGKFILTSPKTAASIGENEFFTFENAPETLPKSGMRLFWKAVQDTRKPGTYFSGDFNRLPLGYNLIREFKNNKVGYIKDNYGNETRVLPYKWDGILKELFKPQKWFNRKSGGLSTDSYLALLKQAKREDSPYLLRYSPDGAQFNDRGIENKFIYDLLEKTKTGEATQQEFLDAFHNWVSPYGGMDARIVNGEIIIPHPFLYKKKQGGKMNTLQFLQKGKPITINRTLPNVVVVPQRLYLDTYYPVVSEFPFTGHSAIDAYSKKNLEYDEVNDEAYYESDYATIDKMTKDAGYNLVTNNCADATRCALEAISGKKMNPNLFTTPGDVLDFFKENFDVVKDKRKSKFGNPVYYTTISRADFEKVKKLQEQQLSQNRQRDLERNKIKKQQLAQNMQQRIRNNKKYKEGSKISTLQFLKNGSGIHIKKKNRGKFTDYCGGKVTDSCIRRAKASGNPTLVKRATFAANARKWKH